MKVYEVTDGMRTVKVRATDARKARSIGARYLGVMVKRVATTSMSYGVAHKAING